MTASPLDLDPTNNTSTCDRPIQVAGTLAISKSADRAQLSVGEGVVDSVVVTSSGPSAALGVTVQTRVNTVTVASADTAGTPGSLG